VCCRYDCITIARALGIVLGFVRKSAKPQGRRCAHGVLTYIQCTPLHALLLLLLVVVLLYKQKHKSSASPLPTSSATQTVVGVFVCCWNRRGPKTFFTTRLRTFFTTRLRISEFYEFCLFRRDMDEAEILYIELRAKSDDLFRVWFPPFRFFFFFKSSPNVFLSGEKPTFFPRRYRKPTKEVIFRTRATKDVRYLQIEPLIFYYTFGLESSFKRQHSSNIVYMRLNVRWTLTRENKNLKIQQTDEIVVK